MPLESPEMATIEGTHLWRRTLAPRRRGQRSIENHKALLREIFLQMRARVANIVQDISKDLREFTIHDITHLDSLWEMADLILDEDYEITPLEAFVFGGSVLLHDAGLTLSAYPGGWEQIQSMPEWEDGVVIECRRRGIEVPASIASGTPEAIREKVLQAILRENHAKQAALLAAASWSSTSDGSQYHIIEDQDARKDLGPLIGEIANSHWWSLPEVERQFARVRNAPAWCRFAGPIKPLVVACLLRCADAIHLDGRRAPRFNRARLRLSEHSALHWDFQERLDAPSRVDDSIYFTGGVFRDSDFAAWWLCHDFLTMANAELEGCHALLSDKQYRPFAARRINSQNDVSRLSELIKTDGWTPVDAPIRITNVSAVVLELGGKALYQEKLWVVLRELIQNGADAVRARRILEGRPENWGSITLGLTGDCRTLIISDTGIGMSQFVIKRYLLDFFSSFWTSNTAQTAFRGQVSRLNPTGKFGIGFFSVFMIARDVKVITRTALSENAGTIVVEFTNGYCDRPILRNALESERLVDPGTRIEVTFLDGVGLTEICNSTPASNLQDLTGYVAPTLDVDIIVSEDSNEQIVVRANDWKELNGWALFKRIAPGFDKKGDSRTPFGPATKREYLQRLSRCLSDFEHSGKIVGRLSVMPDLYVYVAAENSNYHIGLSPIGVITNGGLRVGEFEGFAGFIEGEVIDASRTRGVALVSEPSLQRWTLRQESDINEAFSDISAESRLPREKLLLSFSLVLSYLRKGPIEALPICHSGTGQYLLRSEVCSRLDSGIVYVINHHPMKTVEKSHLKREDILNFLRESEHRANREIFDYVPLDLPDDVLIVPSELMVGEVDYVRIRSTMRFFTKQKDEDKWSEKNTQDPTFDLVDVQSALVRQVHHAARDCWGTVAGDLPVWAPWMGKEREISVPTRDGETVRVPGVILRRRPLNQTDVRGDRRSKGKRR